VRQHDADDPVISFYVDHLRRQAALPGVQVPNAALLSAPIRY
jgi:hypothetical protein